MIADEELHRHALENIERTDALLLGRVTYEMMEAGWRSTGERPDWMEPFARTIDAARPHVIRGVIEACRSDLVSRLEFGSGAVAMRYEPKR